MRSLVPDGEDLRSVHSTSPEHFSASDVWPPAKWSQQTRYNFHLVRSRE
jgi:hypothetical protein